MEKQSRLILAQVDHASGEVLGFAVERIMDHGALNVQLILDTSSLLTLKQPKRRT
jgi:uncharacterized protein (DUF111 family)